MSRMDLLLNWGIIASLNSSLTIGPWFLIKLFYEAEMRNGLLASSRLGKQVVHAPASLGFNLKNKLPFKIVINPPLE